MAHTFLSGRSLLDSTAFCRLQHIFRGPYRTHRLHIVPKTWVTLLARRGCQHLKWEHHSCPSPKIFASEHEFRNSWPMPDVRIFILSLLACSSLHANKDLEATNRRLHALCQANLEAHGKRAGESEGYPENRDYETISRNLSNILGDAVPDFGVALSQLLAQSHVIDFGAGHGIAATEIAEDFNMKVSGISKGNSKPNNLKSLQWFDEIFENLSAEDVTKTFGRGALGFSYWGIPSYTLDFSECIEKISKVMRRHTWTYIFGDFVFTKDDFKKYLDPHARTFKKSSLITLPIESHLNHISGVITKSGEVIDLPEWLRRQKGIRVEFLHQSAFAIAFDGTPLKLNRLIAVDMWMRTDPPARLFIER